MNNSYSDDTPLITNQKTSDKDQFKESTSGKENPKINEKEKKYKNTNENIINHGIYEGSGRNKISNKRSNSNNLEINKKISFKNFNNDLSLLNLDRKKKSLSKKK